MPYKRSYKKKYTPKSKLQKYGDCAKMLMGDASWVASKIMPYLPFNAERKRVDTTGNATPDNSTGSLILLNGLQRGDDASNRIGRSVRLNTVQANLTGTINGAATTTRLRMAFVWDKYPEGVAPAYNDIYHDASTLAFRNWTQQNRFRILKEYKITLSGTGTDKQEFFRSIYFKMPRRYSLVKFDPSNAGNITDIQNGALFLVLFSDQATNTPTVTYKIRVTYLDN